MVGLGVPGAFMPKKKSTPSTERSMLWRWLVCWACVMVEASVANLWPLFGLHFLGALGTLLPLISLAFVLVLFLRL